MNDMTDIKGAWDKFQHEASSSLTRLSKSYEPKMNEVVASKISEAIA